MKNSIIMLFAIFFCNVLMAQEVKLTLNNDDVVEGTTKSLFMFDSYNEIRVNIEKTKEKKDYASTDVKSVKYYSKSDKEWVTFVPLMAQKSMPSIWNKNPKPYSKPVFMQPLYEGKRVAAYKHFITTQTNTKTLQINGSGYVLYFKVKGENVARAFWMSSSIGAKALLKIVFKDFPEMKSIISDLDTDQFYKDPLMIIRKFDEAK